MLALIAELDYHEPSGELVSREGYDQVRPHGSLGRMAPVAFAASQQVALSSAGLVS